MMSDQEKKSPKSAEEQQSPQPVRPVDPQEAARVGKPSQAEGDRETVEQDLKEKEG